MSQPNLFLKYFLGCLVAIAWIILSLFPANAYALTPIRLFDLDYHDCPAEIGQGYVTANGSGDSANCFVVTGKAENKSGKLVVDADVFGRIYDANDEPILQNRNRVGTIREVPPGISDFEIIISVAESQATPLKFELFKASGFSQNVRPFYYDHEDE